MYDLLVRLETLGNNVGTLVERWGSTAQIVGRTAKELRLLWDLQAVEYGTEPDAESATFEAGSGPGSPEGRVGEGEGEGGPEDRRSAQAGPG